MYMLTPTIHYTTTTTTTAATGVFCFNVALIHFNAIVLMDAQTRQLNHRLVEEDIIFLLLKNTIIVLLATIRHY